MWGRINHAAAVVAVCAAAAAPSPVMGSDAGEIVGLIELYNDSAAATLSLPDPTSEQLERLVAGDVVAFRDRMPIGADADMAYRVVALAMVPEDRLRLWVATLGSAEQNAKRMVEVKLEQLEGGAAVWYQFVNLPWPIADRHWTIRSQARKGVAAATGAWWEHGWTLADGGRERAREHVAGGHAADLELRQFDRAVYLPMNEGGWLMARLADGGTLVAVHATAELGGGLPDSWVARYVSRQLRKLVVKIRERAANAEGIVAASSTIYSGYGEQIGAGLLEQGGAACRQDNRC